METKESQQPRACLIGLDGVPFGLIKTFAADGVMPAMQRLIERGHLASMKASLPEISSVSWTSFMTGENPGRHGIFGFTDLREHSYQIRFPNFLDVKVPTIWDKLGARGLKSIVINQPSTYPARKFEGALVSGFVAIELARAVYPLSHLAALERMHYEIDIDTQRARQDHSYLWQALDSTLDAGRRALAYFWPQEWDFLEFVVTGTDRLHHYLWNALQPSHPDHSRFLEYYRRVDSVIEQIANDYELSTGGIHGLYLLSDHGFTGILQEVHLNTWLEQSGYLRFDGARTQLRDLGPGTRAFALDPNRIYLNTKGRFPRGTVEKSDKKFLKDEIAAGLKELEYCGRKVVREVFDTEEIYVGSQAPNGPDLIVLANRGFDFKGSLGSPEVFGRSDLQGMHTWDDAFFWSAEKPMPELAISDIAGLILRRFE
jgi:predicted AlkP superfamily phosphohydrolase/phosphomutase